MLRLAKCCRPVPGRSDRRLHLARPRDHDPPRGLPERRRAARRTRSASPRSSWDGDAETSFRVEIEVDGWDRHRLLEDMSRTFAEAGINILEARCTVNHPMVKNRFVVEVGDTRTLDQAINRLRNIDAVFDAYRVTPGAGVGLGRPGRRRRRLGRRLEGVEPQAYDDRRWPACASTS